MPQQTSNRQRPDITVSDADHDRLIDLATAAVERFPDVAEELLTEMERAKVVTAESVPPNVVRMGSSVAFSSDDGQERRITLVFPGDADIAQSRISVLTPVGAALIGLSEGQSITWTARDGRKHRLTIKAVEQPEQQAG